MIDVSYVTTLLRLTVHGEYRDKEWADQFGHIQEALREKRFGSSPIFVLALDFTDCTWADPIPLLATLLVSAQFRQSGGMVDIYVPRGGEGRRDSLRFTKFLAQEGFLRQCLNWGLNLYGPNNEPLDASEIPELSDLDVDLAYQNAPCIPAEILDLSDASMVEAACERLTALSSLDLVIGERVPAWARDRVRYKLYQVLFETLSNVYEHAYDERATKLCAVYIRYRSGLLGLPQDQQANGASLLRSEHSACPRLDREFLDTSFGGFEVFIVDSGRGLVQSLADLDASVLDEDQTGKYPFQWMSQYVFGQPVAKRKASKATQYGGLYLINKLLTTDRDYVRGFDDRTWIGDFVPAQGKSQHVLANSTYQGLVWHFRLGWKDKTDIGDKWETQLQDVMAALCDENTLREKTKGWWYLDQRFSNEIATRGSFTASSSEQLPRNIIWFVPPGLTKSDIYNRLEKQVLASGKPESTPLEVGERTLFIVDIPVHEAETYSAAFDDAQVPINKFTWATKVQSVVLLSRHFAYRGLRTKWDETDSERVVVKFARDQEFYAKSPPIVIEGHRVGGAFSPSTNSHDLVRWIKWHDSERFWISLSTQKDSLSYIPDSVSWALDADNKTSTLRGYLDFSQALAEPICREILRHVATRLPSIAGRPNIRLTPLDSLTSTLVDDLRWSDNAFAWRAPDTPLENKDSSSVALGSVFVTGSTERAIVPSEGQLVIHYFKHPQSNGTIKPHLLYWPKDNNWFNSLFERSGLTDLKRIGTTAAIAENGWKYFELPRYDADGKLIAARTPRETYADWQQVNPTILKTGHWVYGAQHDFLTANLALALRESFHRNSELGCFIFFNLFRLLGIRKKLLNEEGQIWWDRIFDPHHGWIKRVSQYISKAQTNVDEVAVIVYPSHHNTELIVEKFLSLVSTENVRSIRNRLLAIRGVRTRHGASAHLIQPLSLVRLERVLAKLKPSTVAYLDDAIITGRTLREASNLIAERGGLLNQAVMLLDRQRRPAENSMGVIPTRHYWRLDIPVMGSEGACPLCTATTMAQAFVGALASQHARARVLDVIDTWKAASPNFDWSRGLHPISLGFSVDKRFSLRHGKDLGDPISLTRSTGVLTWVSELHAMTCDDALASSVARDGLNKHRKGSRIIPPDALVEMLSGQVLLFGDEYSNEELQRLLLKLFEVAAELSGKGNHTALALLAIIAKSNSEIRMAKGLWQSELTAAAQRFAEMPEDLQIAMAFLLHIGVLSNVNRDFREAERLLSSRATSVANKYSQLHSEVFDFDGNQHSGPIPRITQWGPGFNRYGLMLGLNSIDKLNDLVAELESQSAYLPDDNPGGFPFIRADFREALSDANDLIDRTLDGTDSACVSFPRNEQIIAAAEKVLSLGQRFHACFFADIMVEQFAHRHFEERTLARVLESGGFCRSGEADTFSFSRTMQSGDFSRLGKKCVCWDQEVVKVISDLAANSKGHPPICDPWLANESRSSLWIRVDYLNAGLVIQLANALGDALVEDIRSRLRLKARTRWKHIFSLGGRVMGPVIPENNDQVVVMSIQLPFAGFLEADKYLKELETY